MAVFHGLMKASICPASNCSLTNCSICLFISLVMGHCSIQIEGPSVQIMCNADSTLRSYAFMDPITFFVLVKATVDILNGSVA